MAISLEVGGKVYSNWVEACVERKLTSVSGTFSFTAASDYKLPFPIPRGKAVRVLIDNKPVLTGFVDKITVSYDASTHTIKVEGRDKTADIVDSKVDHAIEFTAPITLEEVARRTLSESGVTGVNVINNVKDSKPFDKGDLVSAHIGCGVFEFIEKYARKRQVIITTDGLGNLILTRASTEHTDIQLNNVVGGKFNTIKSAEVAYDDSERFNNYKFYSQGNPSGKEAAKGSKLTTVTGDYTDDEVRSSRKYRAIAESSSNETTSEDRAKWEGQVRKAKSTKYTPVVVGHGPVSQGDPYMLNTLVNVNDDFSDMKQELLIVGITSKYSSSEGSTTELELISAEAFALLSKKDEDKVKKAATAAAKGPTPKFADYDNSAATYYKDDFNKS